MTEQCFGRDEHDKFRVYHKPVLGLYDDKSIVSCAWCGKTLDINPSKFVN
jgi:hypothetical protein